MISSHEKKRNLFSFLFLTLSAALGCTKVSSLTQDNPTPNLPNGAWNSGTTVAPQPSRNQNMIRFTHSGNVHLQGSIFCGEIPIQSGRIIAQNSQGFVSTLGFIHNGQYEIHNLPAGYCKLILILNPEGAMPFPLPPEEVRIMHSRLHPHFAPPILPGGLEGMDQFLIPETEDFELYYALHEIYGNVHSPLEIYLHDGFNRFDILLQKPEYLGLSSSELGQ
ncbi:MAG: hypothetical protein N2112_05055 [Gemmataceae bacterium]|nr:hypothetical protein [Gemmataceae bacterium]